MEKILFLSAPLKERIWGGDYFNKVLHKTDSTEKIGEMWSCSGYPNSESIILNGKYKGYKLNRLFIECPDMFGNPQSKKFPILVKIIATQDDLSVQVHPNDEYSLKHENQYGKTEGWLILDSENASIVLGHNAKNENELSQMIQNDEYDKLLKTRNVAKGEFYPIMPGTIHALGKNLVVLEIQQSSDVTYRVYDYHRKDKDGNERQLHVQKAIDVTTYGLDNSDIVNVFQKQRKVVEVWDNDYFNVKLITINDIYFLNKNFDYAIITVCEGKIEIEGKVMSLGESAIVTNYANNLLIKGIGRFTITTSKI